MPADAALVDILAAFEKRKPSGDNNIAARAEAALEEAPLPTSPLTPGQFMVYKDADKSAYVDLNFSHYPTSWLGVGDIKTSVWNLEAAGTAVTSNQEYKRNTLNFALGAGPLTKGFQEKVRTHQTFSSATSSDASDVAIKLSVTELWSAIKPHVMVPLLKASEESAIAAKAAGSEVFTIKDVNVSAISNGTIRVDIAGHIQVDIPWYNIFVNDIDEDIAVTMDIKLGLVPAAESVTAEDQGALLGQYAIKFDIIAADFHGQDHTRWARLVNTYKDLQNPGTLITNLFKSQASIDEMRRRTAKGIILAAIESGLSDGGAFVQDTKQVDLKELNSAVKLLFKDQDFFVQINPRMITTQLDIQLRPQGSFGSSAYSFDSQTNSLLLGISVALSLIPEDAATAVDLVKAAAEVAKTGVAPTTAQVVSIQRGVANFLDVLRAYPAGELALVANLTQKNIQTITEHTSVLGYEVLFLGASALEAAASMEQFKGDALAAEAKALRSIGNILVHSYVTRYFTRAEAIVARAPTAWTESYYKEALIAVKTVKTLRARKLLPQ